MHVCIKVKTILAKVSEIEPEIFRLREIDDEKIAEQAINHSNRDGVESSQNDGSRLGGGRNWESKRGGGRDEDARHHNERGGGWGETAREEHATGHHQAEMHDSHDSYSHNVEVGAHATQASSHHGHESEFSEVSIVETLCSDGDGEVDLWDAIKAEVKIRQRLREAKFVEKQKLQLANEMVDELHGKER